MDKTKYSGKTIAGFSLAIILAVILLTAWLLTKGSKKLPVSSSSVSAVPASVTRQSVADGMVQVYIPAGEFLMGVKGSTNNDGPAHTVYLDAYWIDRTPITNAMYAICVQAGACAFRTKQAKTAIHYGEAAYADHPVVYITWFEADIYCKWAGRRLPSEAEWEKAARGTDGRRFPWGEASASAQLANFNDLIGDTTPIGNYPAGASPYGVLDMSGNVRQWIADWYETLYYRRSPLVNPAGPPDGEKHVLRGGSFSDPPNGLRTTTRFAHVPDSAGVNRGFRCAGDP